VDLLKSARVFYLIGYVLYEGQVVSSLQRLIQNNKIQQSQQQQSNEESDDNEEDILFSFNFAMNNIDIKLADLAPEIQQVFIKYQHFSINVIMMGW